MSRIKIKAGEFVIEYEGDQKFITDGLLDLAKEFSSATADKVDELGMSSVGVSMKRKALAALSTSSIAQKLGSRSGSDLAVAAAAHLILVKKKDKFSTADLLAEMREARSFYKKSYSNNLANYIKRLVSGGRFNHLGGDDYSLSESEIGDLGAKLA